LVWVEASLDCHAQVIISVCDQGEGIPNNDAEPLFEQFYSTKANGLGMGLSISRSLVEAHGGQLIGENLPKGGATFRVILPGVLETENAKV
jgi:two-component system sensor kinase FixL